MKRRRIGGDDGPEVSQICYGTMRLRPIIDDASPADHLNRLHDAGIDTLHSSHEYDVHPLFLDALQRSRATGRNFQHIVKLSEPSFDHDRFDPKRLQQLIDDELASLGAETLTCVQWLVRTGDPQQEERPQQILQESRDEIDLFFTEQIEAGKIRSVVLFPYTVPFAEQALGLGLAPDLAVYLNLEENEYTPLLDRCRSVIAIRPLAGGRLAPAEGLPYPLLHPRVASMMLSINSRTHLEAALESAGDVQPDLPSFEAILDRLGQAN